MNLAKRVKIQGGAVGESTTQNSVIVDTKGAEGVLFIAVASTLHAGAASVHSIQGGANNSTVGMVTHGPSQTVTSTAVASADARLTIMDLYKPLDRYNRMQINGSSSGLASVVAIRYGLRKPGSTMAANYAASSTQIAGSTTLISPTSS